MRLSHAHAHELPRDEASVAIVKEARRRTVPLVTSTWLSISCSWPFHQAPSFAAVDISTGICSTCAEASASGDRVAKARATTPSSALKLA